MRSGIFNHQRGDTIAEVLIAMGIVSLILGGAYVTVNSSLNAEEQAQERSIALQVTQNQIELLKSYVATKSFPNLNSGYCMDYNPSGPMLTTSTALCYFDNDGNYILTTPSSSDFYKVDITNGGGDGCSNDASNPQDQVCVETTWQGLGTGGVQNVELDYRLE